MIDLRSDTLTRPTPAMLDAMSAAFAGQSLGDATLFGDSFVRELEKKAARLTGKEEAVFMPSGSMANLAAILAHKAGGTEILVDYLSHIARMEFGGAAILAGLYPVRIPSARGEMDLGELAGAIDLALSRQRMAPALICLESTHNHSGGHVPGLAYMREVCAMARKIGSPVHLDGARLFNAATALNASAGDIAEPCDSVAFCVSKGLSAPYGALLAGSGAVIARARVFMRMLGGGMRQVGGMAAAALVALDIMPQRLIDDHRRAKGLWAGLRAIDPDMVDAEPPQSNILMAYPKGPKSADWVETFKEHGLYAQTVGPAKIRFVTHRHIEDADVKAACEAVAATYKKLMS